ncbi:sigma-70 family RNA polymerase sigma factor [uncultured Chitinophaga sp.]|uniref:RNA polymerase sigma factor n=1 Tax=uncultured Chitinophaga sp. TaxID=339340 RepID=UPI0025DD6D13|nr:sigma-70 family RNA polymerase sigma factor [uncultured Chitinophaga sp.]
MELWLEGDESAFKGVVNHYYHQMYSFALQMTHNREDTEELVMNSFLRLWQHKNRVIYVSRPDEYLFGILRREVAGYARKRVLVAEPMENIEPGELGTVEHPQFNIKELRAKYQAALDKLTPRQREVFQLSREQELTQQEIANTTGLSINTVGNHMNAALKVFRKEMNEYPNALPAIFFSFTTAELLF